jgi:ribonucleoside-diphosphate reductase alpha chain
MAMAPEQVGIGIRRHFTQAGTHPYDTVQWERRDARIPNYKDGGDAFFQPGVEFPVGWSQNATNIVAQKYFRGTLGTTEREWSLRQVIDRIADTIVGWGIRDGYFSGDEDAETFRDELKYVLVHQRAAFNSPVWFNIGVKGVPQQASACQPWDALVSTPDGLKPIGQLVDANAIGTKVYDANGLTRIVAVKSNGTKPVHRIHLKSGHALDVTADHLVWRVSGERCGAFVAAGDLRPGDKLEWHRTYSHGEGEITSLAIAEAALAGWLQSDGFVGQYAGTNKSLTIEAMTVTAAELEWVTTALDRVFPEVHRHERTVDTQDASLDCRRTRLYGNGLSDFVERWQLRARGVDMRVPEHLFTAPLPVVAAYLRSIFQAEGYVSIKDRSSVVGLAMISSDLVRGVQQLLHRFGIFSRVRFKADKRADRKGTLCLSIQTAGDRRIFADEIGFIDPRKADKLERSFDIPGLPAAATKCLEIDRIEALGDMPVYDIQTESGEYLSGNLRVHNCFILAVEDTMQSILNWYVEEGTIFKGGSGSGINLSTIRSSHEQLAGGGTASGPVSFMRGADASAGTIKSGGKTRRAAKMVVLNADHPDIEEFIWCKAREERKARALSEAGFDMDLDGTDYHSIQYQNANNSVRVTDEFMRAVVEDRDWQLVAVSTGEAIKTIKARELMHQIATAAWECADPGMQFDTTINKWHTAPNTGRINASNPCSEYVHLDNSACNLASLNLLKYLGDDGTFDVEGYKQTVQVIFTAQEILVGNADYPTPKIAETSRRFRQLGIGYANLGALLMAQGLPYDSNAGRAWGATLTALLTGQAYATSGRIASRMGPFAGYVDNREPMLNVLRMHRAEAANIDEELVPPELLSAAQRSWDEAVEVGERHGVRNSQASVIAPTGTIGLALDCDTTGIEPDLALTKAKKLVGGGTMFIVNQTVPRALRSLGYDDAQVDAIVKYIDEHKTIVGAPQLRDEHLPVFACAMGDNTIHYMGHVKMMAAVQPFVSGAISKTINMPEDATVEEVEDLHIEAWKLGLKAVAIYRDNCKVAQPLATQKKASAEAPAATTAEPERIVETVIVQRPVRQKLPRRRISKTFSFRVADCHGYVTVGEYEEGRPGEIFLKVAKQGSTLAGIMDAFAISVSHGLQYGVPLKAFVEMFTNMRFEPAGMTDDPDIRFASSLVDYIFRRLAVEYLTFDERSELGIHTVDERLQPTLPGVEEAIIATETVIEHLPPLDTEPTINRAIEHDEVHLPEAPAPGPQAAAIPEGSRRIDAPYCYQCGMEMQRAGSCYVCSSCGTTSGCS